MVNGSVNFFSKPVDNRGEPDYNPGTENVGGVEMKRSYAEKESRLFHDLKKAFAKTGTVAKYCLK